MPGEVQRLGEVQRPRNIVLGRLSKARANQKATVRAASVAPSSAASSAASLAPSSAASLAASVAASSAAQSSVNPLLAAPKRTPVAQAPTVAQPSTVAQPASVAQPSTVAQPASVVAKPPASKVVYRTPRSIDAEEQIRIANQQLQQRNAALQLALAASAKAGEGTQAKTTAEEAIQNHRLYITSLEQAIREYSYVVIMTQLIGEKGLKWIEVSGNGNCFFLSLSFVLTKTFPDIAHMPNNFLALFLRKLAIEQLIQNADQLNRDKGWPLYEDIFGEDDPYNRTPTFDALSLKSKTHFYRKIMSKYYSWPGNHEIGVLIPFLANYCFKVYNYGAHRPNQPPSFNIDFTNDKCDSPEKQVLQLFHTGVHYDALLTFDEFRVFEQLPTTTEALFRGTTDDTMFINFTTYVFELMQSNDLAEIIRLEGLINLIKIELTRRRSNKITTVNRVYDRLIKEAADLLEAEGAIPWEDPANRAVFDAWQAAEVAIGSSKEQPIAAQRAVELREKISWYSSNSSALKPTDPETMAIVNQLLTSPTAEETRLLPNEFLQQFPQPMDERSLANEIYKGYDHPKLNAIFHGVRKKLNEEISFSEIIPRIRRDGKVTMGGLFQSNYKFAADPASLTKYKINLIVQTSGDPEVEAEIRAGIKRIPEAQRPLLLELRMDDSDTQDIERPLIINVTYNKVNYTSVLELIEAVRNNSGNVLINCAAGMSRSATIVLMYLMRRDQEKNMSLLNSWRFLKFKRPAIIPNKGFVEKLQAYEVKTRGSSTVSLGLVKLDPFSLSQSLAGFSTAPVNVKIPGLCPVCGHQNPATAKQCEQCTVQLQGGGGKRMTRKRMTHKKKAKSQKRK